MSCIRRYRNNSSHSESHTKLIKILHFVFRNITILVIGIGMLVLVDYILHSEGILSFNKCWKIYVSVGLSLVVASEATLFIDRFLTKKLRYKCSHGTEITIKVILILLVYNIIYFSYFINFYNEESVSQVLLASIFAIIFILMLDTLLIMSKFYKSWKKEKEDNDKLREDKLKSDLKALQNQLNPHFLFNSLNVLVSEIYDNPARAAEYTVRLSEIYRYVLKSSEIYTIALSKEIAFLSAYIYIYKAKYGEALLVDINIDDRLMSSEVPPLVLQILVENAIKHNAVLSDNPLKITINSEGNMLWVCNNLIPKQNTFSTTTGLNNIRKRYEILSDKNIEVFETGTEFKVKVPLLETEL